MNPIENVYDPVIAGTLLAGAGATYDGELFMRCWAGNLGCRQMEIIADSATDTLVFVAADDRDVFVCFRGTADLRNWITDLDFRLVNISFPTSTATIPAGVKVHDGFQKALAAVEARLLEVLARLGQGRKQIIFLGHSLGGALAMLAAARYSVLYPACCMFVYTYGQPRVGNQAWRNWYNGMLRKRTFRIIHAEDIVPRVPWLLWLFRHAGIEIFYDALGAVHQDLQWWLKVPSDVFGTWAEWRRAGRIALIADHSWITYEPLLAVPANVNPVNLRGKSDQGSTESHPTNAA